MTQGVNPSDIIYCVNLFKSKGALDTICTHAKNRDLSRLFSCACFLGVLSSAHLAYFRQWTKFGVLGLTLAAATIFWINKTESTAIVKMKMLDENVDLFLKTLEKAHTVASKVICDKVYQTELNKDNSHEEKVKCLQTEIRSVKEKYFDKKDESFNTLEPETKSWRNTTANYKDALNRALSCLKTYSAPSELVMGKLAKVRQAVHYLLNGINEDEQSEDKKQHYVHLNKIRLEVSPRLWLT